ncbi:hypothetical protein [Nocardia asteroides]|uniref:hypothetical protein n=1 Tax=Nocardia asteroides TaxID=1824 RepID=UPI0033F60F61
MPTTQDDAPPCPECAGPMIEITYGFPTPAAVEADRRGEIILGGCCVSGDSPRWGCQPCLTRREAEDHG